MLRRILPTLLLVSAALLVAGFLALVDMMPLVGASTTPPHSRTGDSVPVIRSLAAFRGRTTLVVFVATSSMYCAYEARHDLPVLLRWARSHDTNVAVVNGSDTLGMGRAGATPSTGTDGPWTPNRNPQAIERAMAAWAAAYRLAGHVYVNPGLNLFRRYTGGGFPTGIILSARGRFVAGWAGVAPPGRIEAMLAPTSLKAPFAVFISGPLVTNEGGWV